ncbi:MAG: hypothetical protein JO257_13380 [Deltaproteobacteria bacterium]|nr:hypothetical protein [Deltaproteobacteria bacterium]
MPTTGEWCAPTAELSATQLGTLVEKTRRETAVIHALKPTADPPPPRMSPTWSSPQRRPRQVIRRISGAIAALARPATPVYPTAPSSRPWLLPLAVLALAASVLVYLYS